MVTETQQPTLTVPKRRRRPLIVRWAIAYGPSLLIVVASFALWEGLVRALHVPDYLLPTPSAVVRDFAPDRHILLSATWVTFKEVLLGFLIAFVCGLGLAIVLHLSGVLRRAFYPILIASQTIPIVVLAPILVILMGYNIKPKLVIVALICFFPIVVNGIDGLRSVDPDFVRMMRTLDASRMSIFRRVEFPTALPLIFSGTRIAATYAAIGAIFGEWSGSTSGLGYVMLQATPNLDTSRVLAAVFILSALSLLLFGAVSVIEWITIPWARIQPRET
jgi:putative hydroxymethylpyrimidine transport system permease protein